MISTRSFAPLMCDCLATSKYESAQNEIVGNALPSQIVSMCKLGRRLTFQATVYAEKPLPALKAMQVN